ncbi:MAG: glycogen-binding domain-containing protein [Desulfobacterium sp.]|jgi:1,4-alpha-glucan branching enzyme|nr:glycogen-binding domain-containing protein [Desulfobacterium sp.]
MNEKKNGRKKNGRKKTGRKKIVFTFHAPEAVEVQILGDFNRWNGKKHSMKKGSRGVWTKVMMLMPGTYEYKYKVDGIWMEDPTNLSNRVNPFGTYNNILKVG